MNRMWDKIIPFVVMVMAVLIATLADQFISQRTYLHTALKITCLKCPPGTYRVAHCTSDNHQASCETCPEGQFQTDYTVAESCEPCRTSCKTGGRENLVRNCSATTNNVCVCKSGYFRHEGLDALCVKHKECPKGMGVIKVGTPNSDTVCKVCDEGYFSPNKSLTQICQPCSQCPEGYKAKRTCPQDSDTECVPEEEEDNSAPIIVGVIVGTVITFAIVLVIIVVVCARKGRGPEFFKKCFKRNSRSGDGTSQEKAPLSVVTIKHDGTTNGDMVDRPQCSNGGIAVDPSWRVSDSTLTTLSHDLISNEWQFFFRILIGESADSLIDEAILNQIGVREQIYSLLRKWKQMKGDKATKGEIVRALKESDKLELVAKYSHSTDV